MVRILKVFNWVTKKKAVFSLSIMRTKTAAVTLSDKAFLLEVCRIIRQRSDVQKCFVCDGDNRNLHAIFPLLFRRDVEKVPSLNWKKVLRLLRFDVSSTSVVNTLCRVKGSSSASFYREASTVSRQYRDSFTVAWRICCLLELKRCLGLVIRRKEI